MAVVNYLQSLYHDVFVGCPHSDSGNFRIEIKKYLKLQSFLYIKNIRTKQPQTIYDIFTYIWLRFMVSYK